MNGYSPLSKMEGVTREVEKRKAESGGRSHDRVALGARFGWKGAAKHIMGTIYISPYPLPVFRNPFHPPLSSSSTTALHPGQGQPAHSLSSISIRIVRTRVASRVPSCPQSHAYRRTTVSPAIMSAAETAAAPAPVAPVEEVKPAEAPAAEAAPVAEAAKVEEGAAVRDSHALCVCSSTDSRSRRHPRLSPLLRRRPKYVHKPIINRHID